MKAIFLKDLSECCVDAVIIAETSAKEDIQEAINTMKAEKSEHQWEDLLEALPDDCTVYDRWGSEEVYY